jgi:GT2 family glycosyltransferase
MPATDLLRIPRRQGLGCLMDRLRFWRGMERLQRVRRKRFLELIRSSGRERLVRELVRDPAGLEFQAALQAWARKSAVDAAAMEPLQRTGSPSRRCSVVINTVDRARDLEITLEALAKVWDPARDELIIVLGPTADHSGDVIRNAAVGCRVIHCPQRNLAVSRNLGWQAAEGRFVAFIDDDASPVEGWLDALLAPLEQDPQAGVAAGFVMDGDGGGFLNRHVVADTLGRAYQFDDAAAARAKIAELGECRAFPTAMGCNMAFRREVLDAIGGFDPFYPYFLEETDVIWRAIGAGFRCVAAPDSRVRHRLGGNLARKPSFEVGQRVVVIRSQIHYIGKFGRATFAPEEIEACLWERALLDLEKIAWDSCGGGRDAPACGDLQRRYLAAVTREFRLDSDADSASLSQPSAIINHAP